jgi:hypothetical protein
MKRLRRLTRAPLLAGVVLGLSTILTQGCAQDQGAVASSPVAATPQEAIGAFVESNGDVYAGVCEQTRSPEDIGKMCSKLIDQRGSTQAHLVGRTFGEFGYWVFVDQRTNNWVVVTSTPLDFLDVTMTIPWPN